MYSNGILINKFSSSKKKKHPWGAEPLSNKELKNQINLTDIQKDILVGTLLGDSSIELGARYKNARLRFDQTFPSHASYLMYIYSHFLNLSGKGPKVFIRKPDIRTNKIYSSIQFKTLSLPCLNYYRDLFYKDGRKIIPNNICDILNARALAFWICDDGGKGTHGETNLYTQAYTFDEILLLRNALKNNFNLETKIYEIKSNNWIIRIPFKQEIPLKDIILPYMHYSMLYKI